MDYEIVKHTLKMFTSNSDFCVFDLETTGKSATPSAKGTPAKVLQIAARRYRYDQKDRTVSLLTELNVLINDPTIEEIDPYLTEHVHHIGMEHIRNAAKAAEYGAELVEPVVAWNRFSALLRGAVAMGHNINWFDIPFAQYDAARWDLTLPFCTDEGELLPVGYDPKTTGLRSIDTLLVARLLWHRDNRGKDKAGYRLRSLATMLHVKTDPTLDHNALGDIDTNWLVWLAMLDPYLRSFAFRFMNPKKPANQYRGMLPKLRDSIPTAAQYAELRLTRDAEAIERAARSAEGLEENAGPDMEAEDGAEVA
jgi:DNA polymerase III epsilon subunit-like protein